MIQVSMYNWKIESKKGSVLKDNILVHNESDAVKYVELYISSFPNWDYNIIPLNLQNSPKVFKK